MALNPSRLLIKINYHKKEALLSCGFVSLGLDFEYSHVSRGSILRVEFDSKAVILKVKQTLLSLLE